MMIVILILSSLLGLFSFLIVLRSSSDKVTKILGYSAVGIAIILFVFQVITSVVNKNEKKSLENQLTQILVRTIDEASIKKTISNMVDPNTHTIESLKFYSSKRFIGKEIIAAFIALPVDDSKLYSFIVIDTGIEETFNYIPLIPGKKKSNGEECFLGFLTLPTDFIEKNSDIQLIYKLKTGRYLSKKAKIKDYYIDIDKGIDEYIWW